MNKSVSIINGHVRPLNHYIVRIPKKVDDYIELSSGVEIQIDTRYDDFSYRVSYGEILGCPARFDTGARIGDTLFFHHHVVMREEQYLNDDIYQVFYDEDNGYDSQAIGYRSAETGEIKMLSDWVFTQIEDQPSHVENEIGLIMNTSSSKDPLVKLERMKATIYCGNKRLPQVSVGDTILFSKDSDYRLVLDNGDVVYRMKIFDIMSVWEK